jgi:RNA polymerase sigma-70 factor (sigma-E family)
MNEPSRDDAFAGFAAAARAPLARTAWLLTGSRQQSEDLVQDALVRTYVAWHRVRRDDALSYARAVLVNRHIDTWRRARREESAWFRRGADPEIAPDQAHELGDDRDEIVRELLKLRPRERTVLVLRYYQDLTEQQVANELGVSVGTVKSTASRALARLRELGDAAGESPARSTTESTTDVPCDPRADSPAEARAATAQRFPNRTALAAVIEPRGRA